MREVRYLSPTSLRLFEEDRTEFYLRYLADERPPRMKQTQPMSIGSAFDARVKSYLVENLRGETDTEFDFENLFASQVEEHNRVWAREASRYVFNAYVKSGALADLMIELEQAMHEPRFEFTIEDRVSHRSNPDTAVPFLGKPDVYFVTKDGGQVIFDWKVNGFCGKSPTSPKKGYIIVRDGYAPKPPALKESRGNGSAHKDAQLMVVNGLTINIAHHLEDISIDWATQLAIYGWVLGEEVGSKFIVGIDQIVSKGLQKPWPLIRVASFRNTISEIYQHDVFERAVKAWTCIQTGYIFDSLPREESDARCLLLDDYHKAFEGEGKNEEWFRRTMRG